MTRSTPPSDIYHVVTITDGSTEELLDVIVIERFDRQSFCEQFDVPVETDPFMLDRYAVGPDDVGFLQSALGESLTFDFAACAYFIEAVTP